MKKKLSFTSPYVLWGITALAVLAAGIILFLGVSHWRTAWMYICTVFNILSPVIYGLFLAYLLNKPINFFERTVFRKIGGKTLASARAKRRAASVSTVMLITLLLLVGAIVLLVKQVAPSIEALANRLPAYFTEAMEWIRRTLDDNPDLENIVLGMVGSLEQNLTGWIRSTLLGQANVIVQNLTSGVIGFFAEILNVIIGFVVAVYVLFHREMFAAQTKKLLYAVLRRPTAESTLKGIKFLDKTCGSYVTARIIDSIIVGIICWVALVIARIPYAILISVLVGITNIIPFFGPFIGAVPAAALLLLESPTKCLIFIVIIIVLQQLDGNVLYPRIQGESLGMSGFWILFSILLFGGLFGFWGFLFGVPAFAVIYHAIRHFTNTRLTKKGLPIDTPDYSDPAGPKPVGTTSDD